METCKRSNDSCPSRLTHDKNLSIVGTGDFGRALASRLVGAGYRVHFGSRIPSRINLAEFDERLNTSEVESIPECLDKSDIIILALHSNDQDVMKMYEKKLTGKIIVDVSNPDKILRKCSNAECMARLLPSARIVKAFNTVSAHSLQENWAGGSRMVPVCGDDPEARQAVMQIAASMGLEAVDAGGLIMARQQEASVQTRFEGWGASLITTTVIFIFWFVYSICRYYVLRSTPYTWDRLPLNTINKVMGCVSLTQLAFCFLPGCIAAFIQIYNGNKNRRFSVFMDGWLKMRKPLGIQALFFAWLHAIMSLCLLSPGYYSSWFVTSSVTVPGNSTQDVVVPIASRLSWMGETTLLFAVLSTGLMTIIGITSLPTVADKLNWKEWDIIFSWVGYLCLIFACTHVTVKAAPSWVNYDFVTLIQGLTFLSQIFPFITLFLKLVLILPCIGGYVNKIRRGWVRGMKDTKISYNAQPYGNGNVEHGMRVYEPNGKADVRRSSGCADCDSCPTGSGLGVANKAYVDETNKRMDDRVHANTNIQVHTVDIEDIVKPDISTTL